MRLFDTARSIKQRDPAAKSILEVLLLYPGVQALFYYRIAHQLYRMRLFLVARMISQWARWLTGIEIHPGAQIGRRLFIDHGMGVVIGETAIVGDDCTIYHGVTLGGKHGIEGKRHPTIKNNVTLGSNSQIIGNITLGNHVTVGAGAVVTKDVIDYLTVVGIPARPIPSKPKQ